jgi:hypothetical protein
MFLHFNVFICSRSSFLLYVFFLWFYIQIFSYLIIFFYIIIVFKFSIRKYCDCCLSLYCLKCFSIKIFFLVQLLCLPSHLHVILSVCKIKNTRVCGWAINFVLWCIISIWVNRWQIIVLQLTISLFYKLCTTTHNFTIFVLLISL